MYVVERFGAFAEASRRAPIAPDVLHHAKRAVIDWYASLDPGLGAPAVPSTRLDTRECQDTDRTDLESASRSPSPRTLARIAAIS